MFFITVVLKRIRYNKVNEKDKSDRTTRQQMSFSGNFGKEHT
jgi:hypothetical protein